MLLAGSDGFLTNPGKDIAENLRGEYSVWRLRMPEVVCECHSFGREKGFQGLVVLRKLRADCLLDESTMFG